ncbi:hypothetical protein GQ55_3G218800 [Panicum hallii var. hallii]|uniref:Uncharacterized protein n=1 Tax=Panicum hallii var. hallii TaxID=1504633 RepID=A0A2T7EC22_9POAL|nr:hypothetical protein GQ55_3G218800 [Panicum hallii var. hallii]
MFSLVARKRLKGKELKDAAALLSLAPPGSHDEASLIWSNTAGMHSQMTPSAPDHLAAPILESSYGVPAASYMVPRTPDPCLPLFPVTPTGEGQKRVMATADPRDQGSTSNVVPAHRPASTLPFGWSNGDSFSHGIQRAPAPHLPTSAMASMAGAGRWPTMPAVASTNGYGIINRTSASIAPRPAYLAPPFSQPNSSGMGPNGVMRAPAPHLAALYMPAAPGFRRWSTSASSVTGTALPLPATQTAIANTIGGLAPSYPVPAGAMVAHRGLPIRMEYAGAYHDTATTLALGVQAAAAGAQATSSVPAPAAVDIRDGGRASAFNPWCPRGFEPDDGPSSSSRQAQELQGGSNQGEKRTKPLLDLFKP